MRSALRIAGGCGSASWLAVALVLGGLTIPAVSADPATVAEPMSSSAIARTEFDGILETLDGLERRLTDIAERALVDADAAVAVEERRRHERLYDETSRRLGELQSARLDFLRELDRLIAADPEAGGGR